MGTFEKDLHELKQSAYYNNVKFMKKVIDRQESIGMYVRLLNELFCGNLHAGVKYSVKVWKYLIEEVNIFDIPEISGEVFFDCDRVNTTQRANKRDDELFEYFTKMGIYDLPFFRR
jgi:hypothetical protein